MESFEKGCAASHRRKEREERTGDREREDGERGSDREQRERIEGEKKWI